MPRCAHGDWRQQVWTASAWGQMVTEASFRLGGESQSKRGLLEGKGQSQPGCGRFFNSLHDSGRTISTSRHLSRDWQM